MNATVRAIPRARRIDLVEAQRLKTELEQCRLFLMHLCRTPDQVISVELHDSPTAAALRVAGLNLPASVSLAALRGPLITILMEAVDERVAELVGMGIVP